MRAIYPICRTWFLVGRSMVVVVVVVIVIVIIIDVVVVYRIHAMVAMTTHVLHSSVVVVLAQDLVVPHEVFVSDAESE